MTAKYFILPFVLFIAISLFSFEKPDKRKFKIVIDAGHGGHDSGAPGTHRYRAKEKDIALKVALKLGNKIKNKLKDAVVIYTRNTNKFVDLFVRGSIANKRDADLFISIHCNSSKYNVYGAETYVLGLSRSATNLEVAKRENSVILMEKNYKLNYKGFDPNSPESIIGLTLMQEEFLDQSIEFAQLVQKWLKKTAKRKDRGVKQSGFIVLHQTYMPSVLVEIGFLSNKKEEDFLNSKRGQDKIAQALFKAVEEYKNRVSENIGTDISYEKSHATKKTKTTNKNVIFMVQIATGSRKVETKSYNFKGLKNVIRKKKGTRYKYYYGNTSNYKEALEIKAKVQRKGYHSAFIVAYRDGKRVPLSTIVKTKP